MPAEALGPQGIACGEDAAIPGQQNGQEDCRCFGQAPATSRKSKGRASAVKPKCENSVITGVSANEPTVS